MNKDRRKQIAKLQTEVETIKDFILNEMERDESGIEEQIGKLDDLKGEIESVKDEEQEYFDNMHENMQGGDKGQAAEAAVEKFEEALTAVATMSEKLEALKTALEELNEIEDACTEAVSAMDDAAA